MKLVRLLKGKLVAVAIVSVALVAGATAVFAATPAGQHVVHTITGSAHATATHVADNRDNNSSDNGSHAHKSNNNNSDKKNCPGLPDAQQLAATFSLSTDSTSDDIQAICALHQGTFTDTTPNGTAVSSKRVFGYGEIDMLLAFAQSMGTHNTASARLASDNARSYLAQVVQSCGTTPLETCLKTNLPGFQPGNGNGNHGSNDNGNGNGGGKPGSTPTPPTPHQ